MVCSALKTLLVLLVVVDLTSIYKFCMSSYDDSAVIFIFLKHVTFQYSTFNRICNVTSQVCMAGMLVLLSRIWNTSRWCSLQ